MLSCCASSSSSLDFVQPSSPRARIAASQLALRQTELGSKEGAVALMAAAVCMEEPRCVD
jgi:hypothetical protein